MNTVITRKLNQGIDRRTFFFFCINFSSSRTCFIILHGSLEAGTLIISVQSERFQSVA